MNDYLTFRRMITPFIIEALFVLAALAAIVAGGVLIGRGIETHDGRDDLIGIAVVVLGPIAVRLYAEVMIVVFRINESLTDIRELAVWAAERAHADEEDRPVVA